jgi:uncharacterized protein YjbI with pentapeptide repeats
MVKGIGRRTEPPTQIDLPELVRLAGADLAAHGDYEGIQLVDVDLAGRKLDGAAFVACHLDRCGLDEVSLRRGRMSDCLLTEIHAVNLEAADAVWRDSLLVDPRIGALSAPGIVWDGIRIRGGKLDFVNLSGSKLADVALEGCVIGELDLGQAEVKRLRLDGAVIGVLDVTTARLADVDLSDASLGFVRGIGGLRGATISPSQLLDLAPILAAHVGVRIRAE